MRSTFRILFLLRKSRNKNQPALMIRITIGKERLEFSSKISISPTDWDNRSKRVKGKSQYAQKTNSLIEFMQTSLYSKYIELYKENGTVTPKDLKCAFLGYDDPRYNLLNLFQKKIDQKKRLVGSTIDEKTHGKYVCTRNKVQSFIKYTYGCEDISINKVNYDFITEYEIFLKTNCKCGYNTVIRDLRYLKQITTDAIKSGIIRRDPFYDIKLTSKKGNREYLTLPELNKLASTKLNSETLDTIRNVFLFTLFTGLAYKELYNLKYSDISCNSEGKKYIQIKRSKTGEPCYIPLLEIPELIIEKYKNISINREKIFPIKDCQIMNRLLKEVAICCGIKKRISTHCGRHTFATLMLTMGVSVESISKMLGHTDIKTTQIYARIINTKIDKEMDKMRGQFEELKTYFL